MASSTSVSRRDFLQLIGAGAGAAWAGHDIDAFGNLFSLPMELADPPVQPNMIGAYGPWAASLVGETPGRFSLRHPRWSDVESWRSAARERFSMRLAQPETGGVPQVKVHRQYVYDGLHVEELSWQLPYGPPTEAILVKPEGASERLPGILALHDHGGNKYFGKRKITKTGDNQHPMMVRHQAELYSGTAWANELARRGYVVLAPDAFAFASRRVRVEDVPERIRNEGNEVDASEREEDIVAYNRWASAHESILAKSLFCAGTTWPGVFLAEDQRALDVLAARADVDADRIGVGGLSGGGLRTAYLSGADPRVACAVCVGMMTTWRDYLLHKSYSHTWMIYVPLLAHDMDYPEVLGMRVPLPTLVQNNTDDALFTLPEMQRADTILQAVFEKAGAADRYDARFYPGPHKFDVDMQQDAFAWFDRWLKKGSGYGARG